MWASTWPSTESSVATTVTFGRPGFLAGDVVRLGDGDGDAAVGLAEVVAGVGGSGGTSDDEMPAAEGTAAGGTSAALGSAPWASAWRLRPTTVNPVPITTAVAPA